MNILLFKVSLLLNVLRGSGAGDHEEIVKIVRKWWESLSAQESLSCQTNFPLKFQTDLVSSK